MNTIDKSQAIANQRKETSMSAPSIAEPTIGPVTPVSSQHWTLSRSLLTIGAAGPIVFLAVATLAGLLDPSYNMAGQAMSELALGPNGWLMTANFFVFGLAIIAFAIGFFRGLPRGSWVATGLLVISGIGIFASGIFPADLKGAPETDTGGLHNMLFLVVFLALIISYNFSALALRKLAGWRGHTWATALMPVVVFGLLFVLIGFGSDIGDPLYAVGGLIQRALIAVAFGWMTVTGARLLRAS
jgi:hypothetical protein